MTASQASTSASGQQWEAESYARNARFVADLAAPVVELLKPRPGERILDLGCGDGALSLTIIASGAELTGIEPSPSLVAAARARGIHAVRGDGRALPFSHSFDAVFTNAVLHWILQADEVIRSVAGVLRPGGRFVGEFGGHGNVAAIVVALRAAARRHGLDESEVSPFFFPTPAEYAERLTRGGFEVDSIELIPRPTPLPTSIEGWLDTFRAPYFLALPDESRTLIRREIIDLLAPTLCDSQGNWTADYVRLRFSAHLRE
ncbi:MAG: class I SAM-dependent methyltransferase [Alphaproteobacteria bacterium]|nr:class I SAM-dependent methyltransferase [Alphaproteobacteria bacterium]